MNVCVQAINQSADFMQCRKSEAGCYDLLCFAWSFEKIRFSKQAKRGRTDFHARSLLLLHPLFAFIFFGQLPIGRRKFCSLKHHSTSSWPITVTNLLRKLLPM